MGPSPQGVDWDEDGDIDLVCGESNGMVILFRNLVNTPNGPLLTDAGYIQANGVDIDVGSLSNPEINDWDEDGRKDLIVGSDYPGYVHVYLNIGTNAAPVFGNSFWITDDGGAIVKSKNCPQIADMNEDGLKDLIVADINGICSYWPNHGTNANPVFLEEYELNGFTDPVDPGVVVALTTIGLASQSALFRFVPAVPFAPPMEHFFLPNAEKISRVAKKVMEY